MNEKSRKRVEELLSMIDEFSNEIDDITNNATEEFHIPVGTEVTIQKGIYSGATGIVNDYIGNLKFPYEVLVSTGDEIGQYMWYSEDYIMEKPTKITLTRKRDGNMYTIIAEMGNVKRTMHTNDPDFLRSCSALISEMREDD